jgi:hypothetical protein
LLAGTLPSDRCRWSNSLWYTCWLQSSVKGHREIANVSGENMAHLRRAGLQPEELNSSSMWHHLRWPEPWYSFAYFGCIGYFYALTI